LNCFTPVAWAVETRLNGGYRLVSTYGANPAAPADAEPDDELGDELAEALGEALAVAVGAELAEPLAVGVAEAVGAAEEVGAAEALADGDAEPEAVPVPEPVPVPWHAAPLMVQPAGWPAVPDDFVTKPTVTEAPGWIVASQLSSVTVT
jgi:hypothetical protein